MVDAPELPQRAIRLILHADDLGMNEAVTNGILQSFSQGLLTSTSVLANGPDFERALLGWRELQGQQRGNKLPSRENRQRLGDPPLPFDLGVHLNLTQGSPLTGRAYPSQLLDRQGSFQGIGHAFRALIYGGARYRAAIRAELAAQIEAVRMQGVDITHLNGHQYVELIPLVGELISQLALENRINIVRLAREPSFVGKGVLPRLLYYVKRYFARRLQRTLAATSLVSPTTFFGTAHAGLIDLAVCRAFLTSGERESGVPNAAWEIAFHPGRLVEGSEIRRVSESWHDPLAQLRPQELELLTSPLLVELLASFPLHLGRLQQLSTSPSQ